MKTLCDTLITPTADVVGFFETIKPKIPFLMMAVFVKKLLDNSGSMLSTFAEWSWTVVKRLLYTERKLQGGEDETLFDYHLIVQMQANERSMTDRFVPMYMIPETEVDPHHYLKYCFLFHRSKIKEMEHIAKTNFDKYIRKVKNKTDYRQLMKNGQMQHYIRGDKSNLYPSTNFIKLEKIIKSHFEVSTLVKTYSVLGMLIDGVPGLGKTKFANYAATTRLANHVYKTDMTKFLQIPFGELIHTMFHSITIYGNTIFLIDEIDKYIDYQITHRIENKIPEKTVKNKNRKDVEETLLIEDEAVYKKKFKETFLYEMLSILERDGLRHAVVVIFCSNNFESIFEGVDATHFRSLYSRLMKVKFEVCDALQ